MDMKEKMVLEKEKEDENREERKKERRKKIWRKKDKYFIAPFLTLEDLTN